MPEDIRQCEEIIYSNDYADYVVEYPGTITDIQKIYNPDCLQILEKYFAVFHQRITENPMSALSRYGYAAIPKCFGLLDTSSIEDTGVLRIRRQPYIDLMGQGVLMGFIDTGIEYTHPAFLNADGTTRIHSIWDQTIRDGAPPESLYYGTVYSREQIDEALASSDPLSVVPSTDLNGHGTFFAGIAAGSIDEENDFTGMAPQVEIVVVKLKEVKEYLRDYYCILPDAPAYGENDIMAALRYLQLVAVRENKPITICIGLGSNSGNHSGNLTVCRYMNMLSTIAGVAVVTAAGNEGNMGHHYESNRVEASAYEEVEFRVSEGENGVYMELWSEAPNLISVGAISPTGNFTGRVPIWYAASRPITFPLERTQMYVFYSLVENNTGSEAIVIRLKDPTPGVWRLRVYNDGEQAASYNIWMSMENFILPETYFLTPNPNTTVCEPGNASGILTFTAYDHMTDSIYLNASRGYTKENNVKPELAAPGVDVYGPILKGRYGRRTGSSVSAAHGAGAAALMLEWGIVKGNRIFLQTTAIENYLIRGARRQGMVYPNREWGYGILDLYETFADIQA